MIVQVCIGSSCHLKGSHEIVELMKKAIAEHHLEDEVTLAGSFCLGKCSQSGVSVMVDDEIVCGVTREGFNEFFDRYVLKGGTAHA